MKSTNLNFAAIALAIGLGGCGLEPHDALETSRQAIVTYDAATGTGFVGKGDVQLAFGWNNKQAQDNARAVSFYAEETATYDAVCEWETGGVKNQKTHTRTHKRTSSITSSIAYDARLKNQYTGYNLLGLSSSESDGEVPEVDGPCPGNNEGEAGTNGVWISVEQTASSSGLFVTFNGTSVQLQ